MKGKDRVGGVVGNKHIFLGWMAVIGDGWWVGFAGGFDLICVY